MPPYVPKAEREPPRWITRTRLVALVGSGNHADVTLDECWRQIAHAIADRELPRPRWADARPAPSLPVAVESDEPPSSLDYWLNVEISPDDPDKVREPRPYDPKLVTKREAARLDRTRRFRTPLFDCVFAERLWLHPQISRARPLINPLQGGRNLAIIEGPAPNRPGNENPARRQPSREKPFWSEAHKIVRKWLQDEGCPASGDGNQAALERHIAQWLSEHGHMAGEATIRRHVFRWIAERRRELGV